MNSMSGRDKDEINRMLDEHFSEKQAAQRKTLHEKKRTELYKLEQEDLPKDAIVIPRKNLKSFLAGIAVALVGLAFLTSVFAIIYAGTGQIISNVASGTAPFVVASTTAVTNLNADMVDGYHASQLQDLPASWTCTLRTGTSGICTDVSSGCSRTATASCSGSEKEISGGCDTTVKYFDTANEIGGPSNASRPTGQGWYCGGRIMGDNSVGAYLNAYANCCS